MRPIKLTMTAFGPYKNTESIDFRELRDNRLFVISGATGSGKTTIFDGLCFALYGQASGEDRTDISAMRSQFADDNTPTTVELQFEIGERSYRIMRQIAYVKEGNKTATPAKIEFYELTNDGEVPAVDRQIVTEINQKAEQLIGFTQAQFSQIVMLPQGEFRKFLTSNTENKEAIMRKIFKTEPYREIVERLKHKKDEAQSIWQEEMRASDLHIKQITSVLPTRDSSIFTVLAQEEQNTNQVIEALEEERIYYRDKIVIDKKVYDDAYIAHDKMKAQFHEGKTLNERFNELEKRKQMLTSLSERSPFIAKEEERLLHAERAVLIEQLELQYRALQKERVEKNDHLEKVVNNVQIVTAEMEKVHVQYEIEENKKEEREKVAEQLIRLNDSLPVVAELASKKEALVELEKSLRETQKAFEKTSASSIVESEKVAATKLEIDTLEKQLSSLDDRVELLNKTKETSRVVDEFVTLQKQVALLKNEEQNHELTYVEHKKAYDQYAKQWLMNEAATLAEMLCDGEQCPVCGSAEHPEKAKHSDEVTISKEQLELKGEELSTVEGHYRIAVANLESAMQQLTQKKQAIDLLEIDQEDAQSFSHQLHMERNDLEQQVTALRSNREKLTTLKEKLHIESTRVEQLNGKTRELERHVIEQTAMLDKDQTILDNLVNTIPEDLRVLEDLKRRIDELQKTKSMMEKAWEHVQQLREDSRERITTAQSAERHAKQMCVEVEEKENEAGKRFKDALQKSAFQTEETYYAAKMEEQSRIDLKQEIEHFKQQLHTVTQTVKDLGEILKGKEPVQLHDIEEALIKLKSLFEEAQKGYNESIENEKTTVKLMGNIQASSKKRVELEKELAKVTNLYDVVRGQNSLKLSFERYIQIEYLEQIIHSANERLKDISNGQFKLVRSDRKESHGRQSGLGLDVYDAYTGQDRDVKTLSGGEKFNASLCLALGMADVIQSFQGAVRIDTMFIDEGFGSLDEESLAKAIDTLIDLQKSGRIIGVISHVEELKAAFPAILEVKKSREGHSHSRFLIK